MVGLGRMGAGLTRRMLAGGHEVVVYDVNAETVIEFAPEVSVTVEGNVVSTVAPLVPWMSNAAAVGDPEQLSPVPQVTAPLDASTAVDAAAPVTIVPKSMFDVCVIVITKYSSAEFWIASDAVCDGLDSLLPEPRRVCVEHAAVTAA